MHHTLVLAISACFIASAQAHPKVTSSVVYPEAVTQAKQAAQATQVTPVTRQKTSEVVKVNVSRAAETPVAKESTPAVAGGWGKYGTLLATLVVMCAIALRRQRLGRP